MQTNKNNKNLKNNPLNTYAQYSGIAFKMAIVIGGGIYGGIKLDEKFHSSPLFTLIFSLLSVALAIYFVIKDLSK